MQVESNGSVVRRFNHWVVVHANQGLNGKPRHFHFRLEEVSTSPEGILVVKEGVLPTYSTQCDCKPEMQPAFIPTSACA